MKIVVPVLALAGLVRAVSITGCHQHGSDVYCITESGEEVQVALDNPPAELPSEYTDCHTHGDKSYCVDPNGEDVEVLGEVTSSGTNSEDSNSQSNEESSGGENCHFHAGVEYVPILVQLCGEMLIM
ncbi:hypothetical protein ASPVEDRAFT_452656 [Aspergillus versicolor CBS 583.65]|uniref:Uncharacterized protein n=1 Tax=Aspergillus versicolor CBS 583.65 TaxID=1036611 RepID=A0A1L9PA01_ASPVE|nr:uncharacterized protein ASPVEDRAFT_452656 [Aspergillus versicolor CBS 583.65]OJI98326.1 hypothetical protein ASPVEDRAFT_452656 [Aspergillus versicolor CBS 583.65]